MKFISFFSFTTIVKYRMFQTLGGMFIVSKINCKGKLFLRKELYSFAFVILF